jgi:origin recognition complex subunit 1
MIRINFQPYTTAQLEQIVHARLGGSNDVLSKDAVKFAAMKVSSISGDARRVLDICRCVLSPYLEYIFTLCNGQRIVDGQ